MPTCGAIRSLLDSLFLLRSHKRFVSTLRAFEKEIGEIGNISDNARMIALQILYTNRINNYFREGLFSDGIKIIPEVEEFIRNYSNQLDLHHRMVLYYKIACLYFGNGNYGRAWSTSNGSSARVIRKSAATCNAMRASST